MVDVPGAFLRGTFFLCKSPFLEYIVLARARQDPAIRLVGAGWSGEAARRSLLCRW